MSLLAIAVGTLIRRRADDLAPVVDTPPAAPEFRPITDPPSVVRRRNRRHPLDPATADALSAFEADPDRRPGGGG